MVIADRRKGPGVVGMDRTGRFGLAGLGAVWLIGGTLAILGDGAEGTGQGRSAVPVFQHPEATSTIFGVLAAILLIAALTMPTRWLTRVAWLWFAAQVVHLTYHVYDIGILPAEDRLRLLGGFAVILGASAYFIWLLRRGTADPPSSADTPSRPEQLANTAE